MQTDSSSNPSFFDDADPSIGFFFQYPTQAHQKDLSYPSILGSKLLTWNKSENSFSQGNYALHNSLLASKSADPFAKCPANVLDLAHSQLRLIPFNCEKPVHGFSVTKNGIKHEFFSEDEQTIGNWITALKRVCVLTNFHEEYKASKMIGKGSFAKVYLVESRFTGKNFAVKAFTKESLITTNKTNARATLVNEIDIMRTLDHENIIKLHEVYESERSLYLVLELIQGKSLQDVIKRGGFADNEARVVNVISSILDALAYMASKGIMHRDLKPDNILLDKGDKVKIVDFGLATFIDLPEYLFKKCGTPGYIAPEVFKYDQKDPNTYYDHRCDAFSAGCIMFFMLFGFIFFDAPRASEILRTNRKFVPEYRMLATLREQLDKPGKSTSYKEGIDLLLKLLEFNQKQRFSASEALVHPYLFSIMQQKLAGSFDVYQDGGCSASILDRCPSIAQEGRVHQANEGSLHNTPQRFAEKDSLYLDMGRPEINGRIDTIGSASASGNGSLLASRADSNGISTPESARSAFAKKSGQHRSARVMGMSGNKSVLKAAIICNMQKNKSNEESKEDNSATKIGPSDQKKERRYSEHILTMPPNDNSDQGSEQSSSPESVVENDVDDRVPVKISRGNTRHLSIVTGPLSKLSGTRNTERAGV